MRKRILAGLTFVAAAAGGVGLYVSFSGPDTVSVRVRSLPERVPAGTTLAEAATRFELEPRPGNLVDVQGSALRRGAFPGRITLNGASAPGATELRKGDRIEVVDGRDRREPVERLLLRVRGGEPSNPQFTLARTPGEQEVTRGTISGKLASVSFHPTGPARMPRAVALTFDDGPSRYTPQILAVLRRLHTPATFFVVGNLAERHSELVREELAAEMGVGSHSYSHPLRPPFERQPRRRIRDEIEHGAAVLARFGHRSTLFRPPGGRFSPHVVEVAGALGQRIVLWSVDPTDWKRGTRAKQIVRRVLRAVRPGSIVLLHDGGGNRMATIKALPTIIKGIRKRGLRLVLIEPPRRA